VTEIYILICSLVDSISKDDDGGSVAVMIGAVIVGLVAVMIIIVVVVLVAVLFVCR